MDKNQKITDIHFEIANYCLDKISCNSAELAIEAIYSNFQEIFDGGKKISKNWENSQNHYQNLISLIGEKMFTVSSEYGFPVAKKFCYIYILQYGTGNIRDIAVYFLRHRINVVTQEDENYIRQKLNNP